jgi:hypothetical protein
MRLAAAALTFLLVTFGQIANATPEDIGASEVVAVCGAWAPGPIEAQRRVAQLGFAPHEVEVAFDPTSEFSREWVVSAVPTGPSYARANFRLSDAMYPSGRRSRCRFQTEVTAIGGHMSGAMRTASYHGPVEQRRQSGQSPDELGALTISNDAYQLRSEASSERHDFARYRTEVVEGVGVGRHTRFVIQLDSSTAQRPGAPHDRLRHTRHQRSSARRRVL